MIPLPAGEYTMGVHNPLCELTVCISKPCELNLAATVLEKDVIEIKQTKSIALITFLKTIIQLSLILIADLVFWLQSAVLTSHFRTHICKFSSFRII